MKHILFTKQGFEEVKKEKEILTEKRKHAVLELKKAREMGDLSENGYYKAARFELSAIDRRLRELKYLLVYGKVAQKCLSDIVEIGSKVTIINNSSQKQYSIVGGYESNPLIGKLSHISPIGKALMGKKVGDTIKVSVPSGKVKYKIIKIS